MKTRVRFIFNSSWTRDQESEEIIKEAWGRNVQGSRMFKVKQKLKWCRNELIRWSKGKQQNARKNIDLIIQEMEQLQTQAGCRDWEKW